MFDVLLKSAGITPEAIKEIPKIIKEFKDDLGDIKLTGYDNLEMLKKILAELQELNENFRMIRGKDV